MHQSKNWPDPETAHHRAKSLMDASISQHDGKTKVSSKPRQSHNRTNSMNTNRLKSLLLIPATAALAVMNPAQFGLLLLSLPAGAEAGELPAREGTLHVLSFGVGAPMDGPPVDDLYGRDAGFVAEALKRSPSAWTRVEMTFVSGLACTPERLRTELERLGKAASASDLVLIHASTHGTTEDGFLRLDGAKGPPVINANALAALPLTRAVPGEHKPLWTMPRVESRNPWGLPDPSALPQDAKPAAKLIVALKLRWEGRVADKRRIDGESCKGVWDFRR